MTTGAEFRPNQRRKSRSPTKPPISGRWCAGVRSARQGRFSRKGSALRSIRTGLRVEQLESRDLLSVIHINSTWVQQAGGEPIILDQPNAQYILDTDINVPGTAFVVGAGNVTLNLNGHQVVFGEGTPL